MEISFMKQCNFFVENYVVLFESTQLSCNSPPHRITESQNYTMVGSGTDLRGSSCPTPLPKQGQLEQAAQDSIQVGFEYLQRRRPHNVPGQPVPGLRHPQSEEVLPRVQVELPMLQFVPVAPRPVAGHH